MALLNSECDSSLSEPIIKILRNNKIFNTVDYLQEDLEHLVNITKLSYKDVTKIRRSIIEKYSPPILLGVNLYKKLSSFTDLLSTCIPKLDEFLQGGFQCGKINEVCGLPDSGKTQLALTICCNVSVIHKQNVIFIDTKNDFSGTRVHEILQTSGVPENDMGVSLERIKVIRIWNMHQLLSFLHELRRDEKKMKCVRLIIIDSLPSLMLQFQGEKTNESLGLLNHFVNIARFLATEYSIPFLIINLLTRWTEYKTNEDQGGPSTSISVERKKPTLGKYWQHIPFVNLNMERDKDNLEIIKMSFRTKNMFVSSDVKEIQLTLSSKGIT